MDITHTGQEHVLIPSHHDYGTSWKMLQLPPMPNFPGQVYFWVFIWLQWPYWDGAKWYIWSQEVGISQAPMVETQLGRLLMEFFSSAWEETFISKMGLRSCSHCSSRSACFHNNSAMFLLCLTLYISAFPNTDSRTNKDVLLSGDNVIWNWDINTAFLFFQEHWKKSPCTISRTY